jgi:hypothetical protein
MGIGQVRREAADACRESTYVMQRVQWSKGLELHVRLMMYVSRELGRRNAVRVPEWRGRLLRTTKLLRRPS